MSGCCRWSGVASAPAPARRRGARRAAARPRPARPRAHCHAQQRMHRRWSRMVARGTHQDRCRDRPRARLLGLGNRNRPTHSEAPDHQPSAAWAEGGCTHDTENPRALCVTPRATHAPKPGQLPTVHGHAVPTGEYQSDPPSLPRDIRCFSPRGDPTSGASPLGTQPISEPQALGWTLMDGSRRRPERRICTLRPRRTGGRRNVGGRVVAAISVASALKRGIAIAPALTAEISTSNFTIALGSRRCSPY